MKVRIELNRGWGWTERAAGDLDITVDELVARLPQYALKYPHRLYVEDKLVAEIVKPRYLKSKVIRYDTI
jgi:hypothetical protein